MDSMEDDVKHQMMALIRPYCDEFGIDIGMVPFEWFYATDDLRNYSFVFPFETQMDRVNFFIRSQDTWMLSIWASLAYITLIFAGQKLMSYRDAFELRGPLIIWNIAMALFSLVGVVRVSHELFRVLSMHGLLYSVCVSIYGRDPVAAFWISMFVRSKFIELFDTAFIVLRKRKLLFLHWYHHVTVLLFAWHCAKEVTAAGRWYAWMNYLVHTFMYSYYAVRAMNFKPPRWVQITVTTMQLSQMVVGVAISSTVLLAKVSLFPSCNQTWNNLAFAAFIYFTYFLLFAKYFYEVYMQPKYCRAMKKRSVKCD